MENFSTCKECNNKLSDGDKFILKSDKCFERNFNDTSGGELKKRPRPIWHYTKKYQGGRV